MVVYNIKWEKSRSDAPEMQVKIFINYEDLKKHNRVNILFILF